MNYLSILKKCIIGILITDSLFCVISFVFLKCFYFPAKSDILILKENNNANNIINYKEHNRL